jgi:hypothetical protein
LVRRLKLGPAINCVATACQASVTDVGEIREDSHWGCELQRQYGSALTRRCTMSLSSGLT